MKKAQLYIGLMSGTSADGIDLALVDYQNNSPQLLASYFQAYSDCIRNKITQLYLPENNEIDRAFSLDIELAQLFAEAINKFLTEQQLSSNDIIAIGNHGQTIRHRPSRKYPFTLQIGCSQTLATLTTIRVIGQFRIKDMVLGGQGAPLVPAFHQAIFSEQNKDVVVVNIGGISNITYLPQISAPTSNQQGITGFDTGPGNALMDEWYQLHCQGRYDDKGAWAATGKVNNPLLTQLLKNEYFLTAPPKSTGREVFNLSWLKEQLNGFDLPPEDVQATLVSLTANSIADAISTLTQKAIIYICGGGAHNKTLIKQLIAKTTNHNLLLTSTKNIDGDSVEAVAFSWLAYAFDKNIFGNIPAVTGARKETVLGTNFLP